jgi:hypothetical protein
VRVLAVQAIDEAAKQFYEHRGFEPTKTEAPRMVVVGAGPEVSEPVGHAGPWPRGQRMS